MYVSLSSLPTVVINFVHNVLDTCTLDMCTLLHIIEQYIPSHMVRTRVGVTVLVTGLGLSIGMYAGER